ncbi:hypothetical protein [Roseibium sp. RKSG952]|uniref:hypothetical protein n=1 Tax=Roseibium sp. RKSG952 TaxID=2529384 RepID=UPI0012BC6C28|nr:hypothetical protein [Roseibium sp. RKSG952]MTI01016.1 hypothetical protein [Roseibium sp. RKSG952]
MKWLWALFGVGVVLSAIVLSEAGQGLLIVLMLSMVGIPLAVALMYVPIPTGILGIYLLIRTVLRHLPGFRRAHGLVLFGLSAALVAGVMYLVPIYHNQQVDKALPLVVAEDVPLSGAKAQGLVVGLYSNADRCGQTCAELLMSSPDIQVVLGRFERIKEGDPATPPAGSATWGLVPAGIGLCPWPLNQASSALRIAIAEAELDGYCFAEVPMAEQIDVVIQGYDLPGDAPGQVRDDKRTELFLRNGDNLRLSYRTTTGFRSKLSVPMVFFSEDGNGLDLGLSLAPPKEMVSLASPVPDLSRVALYQSVLPGDIVLPSFEAYAELSRDQRDALRKREAEMRKRLATARYDAALTALGSGDTIEIAKGIKIANSYLRKLTGGGVNTSDVPLFVALMSAPGDPQRTAYHVLDDAPPEVLMPVVDAILDRLIAAGEGPMPGKSKQRYAEILRLAEDQPAEDIAARTDRLDQLVATPLGREMAGGLMASRGIIGPDQAAILFDFLDARIADGDPEDGFQTVFHGLCLMGHQGVSYLNDMAQRERHLGTVKHSPSVRTSVYNMVLMGMDDDAIRQILRFDNYTDASRRQWAESILSKLRAKAESSLDRQKARGVVPPWRHLCL